MLLSFKNENSCKEEKKYFSVFKTNDSSACFNYCLTVSHKY